MAYVAQNVIGKLNRCFLVHQKRNIVASHLRTVIPAVKLLKSERVNIISE